MNNPWCNTSYTDSKSGSTAPNFDFFDLSSISENSSPWFGVVEKDLEMIGDHRQNMKQQSGVAKKAQQSFGNSFTAILSPSAWKL